MSSRGRKRQGRPNAGPKGPKRRGGSGGGRSSDGGRSTGGGRSSDGGRSTGGGRSSDGGRSTSGGGRGASQPRTKGRDQGTKGRQSGGARRGGPRSAQTASAAARKGLGGDQVEGRQAVRELLMAGRRRVRELMMAEDLDSAPILDEIRQLAHEANVSIREVPRSKLEAAAHTVGPQGVLAVASPLEPVGLSTLVNSRNGIAPFLLMLDGVTDPGNLGALLRTAECAGVTGVVLPRHRAAHVTPTVAKAAQGAIEHLPMATVTGLPAAISDLAAARVWTVGLDVVSESSLWGFQMATEPIAMVLGAEGKGLSRLVRDRCDMVVTIPMAGQLNSLNVSAAGALAMFEVTRARRAAANS